MSPKKKHARSQGSRYLIGIDLGTTNTAMAWMDLEADEPAPQIFAVPQISAPGEVQAQALLPSFVYLPDGDEVAKGALDLPWAKKRDFAVGAWARQQAALAPAKVVSSAKSWLCANNVDRLAPILPWNRENPERQVSPVTAAQLVIEHLRDAWDQQFAKTGAPFADQEIILTVPASFDAVARDLTVKAATQAGVKVTLIEEPQAAFYAWLQSMGERWRQHIQAGETVLVCDIGGGTTDFSLIEVVDEGGQLALNRVAVGDHILLGGDNMDLALAYAVAAKLEKEKKLKLDAWQLAGLTHGCREAKEKLLAKADADGVQKLTVLGRGSSVVGQAIHAELSFAEVEKVLLNGFFPKCAVNDAPAGRAAAAGLRTFGLEYAAEPAITRHLAAFLVRHGAGRELPTSILFNGGVTKAPVLTSRIVKTLNGWVDGGELAVLAGAQPDLAVALGACWYANVRRGNAIRIKAGSPQSYYVGVESTMPAVPGFAPPLQALCVVPFGMEEGKTADVPYRGLGLVVGTTTEFKFFASTNRPDDQVGAVLPAGAELTALPAITATLPAADEKTPPGTMVPVRLKTVLTEIGTLQVWCVAEKGERSWPLEYQVRGQPPAAR